MQPCIKLQFFYKIYCVQYCYIRSSNVYQSKFQCIDKQLPDLLTYNASETTISMKTSLKCTKDDTQTQRLFELSTIVGFIGKLKKGKIYRRKITTLFIQYNIVSHLCRTHRLYPTETFGILVRFPFVCVRETSLDEWLLLKYLYINNQNKFKP